jgi:hypothetical protein
MKSLLRSSLALITAGLLVASGAQVQAGDRGFRVRVYENESAAAPAGELELYRASYALVVGIDAYESGWPRLSNAVKDAREVARALRGQGFEVQEAVNLKRTDLADTLENFFIDKGRDENARLLVWFAGHGYTDAGEGFIMPADAVKPGDDQFRRKALSLRRFGEFMHNARSKHALAIFDACFAGTIFNTARAMPSAAITRSIALPVRAYVSSGDADQQVSDNGEFRKLFVRALAGDEPKADANGDGFLTGTELGLFLSDRVTNLTKGRQVPRYGKLNEAEYDRGDFVFALNTAVAPPYVPPTAPPSGAFSLDDLKKKSQKEKADWATWLASMTRAYADTAAFEKDATAAVDKAAAWERFQAAFTLDDRFSGEDEKMRAEAARRAGSYAARAREEAAAQAEAERLARERAEALTRNAAQRQDRARDERAARDAEERQAEDRDEPAASPARQVTDRVPHRAAESRAREFETFLNDGVKAMVRGDIDAAAESYEAAMRLNSESKLPHQRLCTIYKRKGNQERALTHCQMWLDRETNHTYKPAIQESIDQIKAMSSK